MKYASFLVPAAVALVAVTAFGADAGPTVVLAPAVGIFLGTLSIRKAPRAGSAVDKGSA